jgi:hypothetical protein
MVGPHRLESLPTQLRAAISTTTGAADATFAAKRTATGWRLKGGGVRATFDDREAELDAGGGWLSMALIGFGSSTRRLIHLGVADVSARVNRVLYRYGDVREWYAAGPLGIEQGFTVERRPAGSDRTLTLATELRGSFRVTQSGSQMWFVQSSSGRVGLRYGGLDALDASGRRLPVKIRVHGQKLLIQVDERNARYPLTVDPLIQQGSKLTAGDGMGKTLFGDSVALSADGKTVLIGTGSGAAWVFVRKGSVWSQQGPELKPDDTNCGCISVGQTVALSADGNTALIGVDGNDNKAGAAWVFVREGSVWSQEGTELLPSDENGAGAFGYSVALSADGNTALIGGIEDDEEDGAVWVFARTGSTWSQQGPKLTGGATKGFFGYSVALSSTGDTALIGEEGGDGYDGLAWVFVRSQVTWHQQASFTGSEDSEGLFGAFVALSSDGDTALIGERAQVGGAWIFTRSGSTWSQQGAKILANDRAGATEFGSSVALASDGSTALIGGAGDNSSVGAAWLFRRSGSVWSQLGSKLTPSDESGDGRFGQSVALSSDGETVLVGGSNDSSGVGAAWVFAPPAPSCADVMSTTPEGGGPIVVSLSCTGPAGATLSYAIVAGPAHAILSEVDQANGQVTYTPERGYSGVDTFTYRVSDQWGESNTATATIAISSVGIVPHPPNVKAHSVHKMVPVVAPFTPLLLVRAAISGSGLGEIVGLASVRGATVGETIVLRCITGCKRKFRVKIHIGRASDVRRRIVFSPLVVSRKTEIEVDVSAPGHLTRFARYGFTRSRRALSIRLMARGCRSSKGADERCP